MKLAEIDIAPYDTLLLDRDGTINVHLIGDYVKRCYQYVVLCCIVNCRASTNSAVLLF